MSDWREYLENCLKDLEHENNKLILENKTLKDKINKLERRIREDMGFLNQDLISKHEAEKEYEMKTAYLEEKIEKLQDALAMMGKALFNQRMEKQ